MQVPQWIRCIAAAGVFGGLLFVGQQAEAQPSTQTVVTQSTGRGEQFVNRSVFGHVFYGARGRAVATLIVLWRGQEDWLSAGPSRRSTGGSSGSQESIRGTNGVTTYSVMRDVAAQRVVINDTDTLKFSPDSTLIVMVDRVDNVGGAPVVTSISVPLVSRVLLEDVPPPPDSARAIMARIAAGETYETSAVKLLNTFPAAREFINRPASRLPQGTPTAAAQAALDAVPARRGPGASGSRGSQISTELRSSFFYERRDTQVVTLIVLSRDDTNQVVRSSSGGSSARLAVGPSGVTRNVQSTEFSTRGTTVSVVRDPGAKRVIVNSRDTLAIPLDSTVILMLDHRGGAGQSPRIASLVVPLVPLALVDDQPPLPSERAALEARFRETGFREGNLTRFLDGIPAVRAFIR